jgi:AcrR family transcriptional regulator
MGTAERRERERLQRRNAIIDAAEKVFFSKGVEETTMEEIARTAELSKGLLYFYFESKEALYLAICERGSSVLVDMFQRALKENESGRLQLEAIGDAYIRFAQEYEDYFNSMLQMHVKMIAQIDPDFTKHKDPIYLVARAISNGIEDGSFRKDLDPLPTAMVLWAQTHGLMQIWLMHPEIADFAELRALAYSFIREAIGSHENSTS